MTHPTPALRIVAILSLLLFATTPTFGVSITWDATTNTTWDTSTANWTGASTTYTEGDDVLFGDTGAGTVAIDAGGVTPTSTTIDSTSNYIFTGGSILGGTLTKSGSGNATLNNTSNSFSSIDLTGGALKFVNPNQLGSGTISFNDTATLSYAPGAAATALSNPIQLTNAKTATIDNGDGSWTGIWNITGTITGGDADSVLLLDGNVKFSDIALTNTANDFRATIQVDARAELNVGADDAVFGHADNTIELSPTTIFGTIMLNDNNLVRDVHTVLSSRIHGGSSGTGQLSGIVSGNIAVGDKVTFTNTNNTMASLGFINGNGIASISDPGNLGGSSHVVTFANFGEGTLQITGTPTANFTSKIRVETADGNGNIPGKIEVQNANAVVNWSGVLETRSNGFTHELRKEGAGTLNFSNIALLSKLNIEVAQGTLNINDNDSGTSSFDGVLVQNGGTLGGTGTIDLAANSSITVISGGTLAPGASIGTLTVDLAETDTSVILASGAILEFELGTPGIGDLLQFNNFTVGDLSLSDNVINFIDVGGLAYGTYTLMSFYSDDGVTPVDHGLTSGLLIGTGLTLGGELDFSSTLGEIRLQVVPEPSSMILIVLGGTLLMRRRQIRRG